MNKGNLNKLVTNYPVELTEEEIANLSGTLAPVIAACGGGGGGGTGGKIYTGIGFVTVNNSTNQIGLTEAANTKLNQDIPTKVSDLSDSANYQTVAGMDEYLTTANAKTLYQTKDDMSAYLTSANAASIYQTKDAMSAYWTSAETNAAFAEEIADLIGLIDGKQNILTFAYDNDKISAINGSALAGQGGTTYSAGAGIAIIDEYISLSSDYIQAITQVSGKQDVLAFTYNSSSAITHINGSAIAGEGGGGTTVYAGTDGVYVDGNNIGLSAGYKTQIEAVSGKITKADADGYYAPKTYTATVNALTGASGNWQNSYEVLTSYSAAGTWLTAHQSLSDYYTKSDTSSKNELSTEFAKYQPTGYYATSAGLTAGKQYAMTTTGWAEVQAGTSFTGVTTASPITGDGLNNTLGLDSNYKTAIEQVSGKVDKPSDMTSNTPYCFSGGQWADLTQTYYSKSEATGTFLQKNLTNTLSGDGTSSNTLGVNWSNLSSNTINSAKSASSAEYLTNGTNYSGYNDITGAINNKLNTNAIKTSAIGNTTYVTAINTGSNDIPVKDTNFWAVNTTASTTAGNDNWQHYVTTSNTFNYYQMIVHPSGTTADNSWNNDNIIHIILEE